MHSCTHHVHSLEVAVTEDNGVRGRRCREHEGKGCRKADRKHQVERVHPQLDGL